MARKNKHAKRSWVDVNHDKQFFVNNGQVLKNINELPKAMKNMDAQTFAHHVNQDKNDFANWVEHCFGETCLAADLRKSNDKRHLIRSIRRQF